MSPMGSEECIMEGITELSRVVQHESYWLTGVHYIRHHYELSRVIQHEMVVQHVKKELKGGVAFFVGTA